MKIALIYTPLRLRKNWSTLIAQDEHIGCMPPLSLAYVAALAEKAGHEVIIIDAVAERLSLSSIVQRVRAFSPTLLGFTLTTYGFHQTLPWIKEIKRQVDIPVMVGGWHLPLYPDETMGHQIIDYAVIGEAENILSSLLDQIEKTGDLHSVPGIAFREQGKLVKTSPAQVTDDLDTVPFPARHLLKNQRYYNILSTTRSFTVMLSARGCPYQCIFCDLHTKKFRMRSAKNFVDEVEYNYREFSIKEFDIYDSSFTIDKERVAAICEDIMRRGLKVSWTARSRIDNVDQRVLKAMAGAGCKTLMYGIEAADPAMLQRLRKYVDQEKMREVISWGRQLGIRNLGFFMIGIPGETMRTARNTIALSRSLGLDYIQITRVTPFPNTELYRMLIESGFGDYWREFTKDSSAERSLPLVGTDLTSEEAMRLIAQAYRAFYFRPQYIFRALKRTRSILELKNSVEAALGLLVTS